MGFYVRMAPGVKLRMTRSGVRAGIGPRAARLWVGAGGAGVSTGAGPVSLYRSLGGRSGRAPSRTSMAAYERQVRRAQRAEEIQQAGAALTAMLTVHQHAFPPAAPPVALPPPPVDAAAIRQRLREQARAGIHWWRFGARRAANARAEEQAVAAVAAAGREQDRRHAEAQAQLDQEWARLQANDPHVVIHTLEEAFEDNAAPATAVDCDGDQVTIVMTMEGEDAVPDRKPALTPSGQPTLHKISKTERSGLYRGWVHSNILATVRETFAVAPGIRAAIVVVLRREPPTPYGEHPLSVIYVGTLTRDRCARIAWDTPPAVDAVLDADDLLIHVTGQAQTLSPVSLDGRPDVAALVAEFERTLASKPDEGAGVAGGGRG